MSCGILTPKYVITALLTYLIQYKKLACGGRNYVEKNSSFMFNPIRPGGGGGSEARMTKLTADNQKPLTL